LDLHSQLIVALFGTKAEFVTSQSVYMQTHMVEENS